MSDRLLKESDILRIAFQLPLVVNSVFVNAVKALPSVDRPQEWIPCSERLPEKDGDYLATLHCKWPDQEYKTVAVEEFRSDGFDENLYVKVVAWMPLPEPWKGADDE